MDAWRRALEAILDAPGVVVMLGPVDVGKTTAATAIASAALRAGRRTAVVDADTGQSDIGPPTTVALALPGHPARRMDHWKPAAAFFVGDTTPQDVYRYLVDGTVRSIDLAQARGARVIVVDTTGWVEGRAAVAAKARKLSADRPPARGGAPTSRRGGADPRTALGADHRAPPAPLAACAAPVSGGASGHTCQAVSPVFPGRTPAHAAIERGAPRAAADVWRP